MTRLNKINGITELKYKIWLKRYRNQLENDDLLNDFLEFLNANIEFCGENCYYVNRHCCELSKMYVSFKGLTLKTQNLLKRIAMLNYRAKFYMSDGKTI